MEVRRVFAVPQDETLVAKVYHKPTVARAKKLVAMLANPPENPTAGQVIFYCWLVDLLGKWLVAMPKGCAKCSHGWLPDAAVKGCTPSDFYPKTRRQSVRSSTIHICTTARNLAAAFCPACAWILH